MYYFQFLNFFNINVAIFGGFTMFRIYHNGCQIEYCQNIAEVNDYISKTLNKQLSSKMIINVSTGKYQIIVYQYTTIYTETYIIERLK